MAQPFQIRRAFLIDLPNGLRCREHFPRRSIVSDSSRVFDGRKHSICSLATNVSYTKFSVQVIEARYPVSFSIDSPSASSFSARGLFGLRAAAGAPRGRGLRSLGLRVAPAAGRMLALWSLALAPLAQGNWPTDQSDAVPCVCAWSVSGGVSRLLHDV